MPIASYYIFLYNKGTSRVGICALSAAWTGSCQADEKAILRYKFRIPLLQRRGSPSCCSIFCWQFGRMAKRKEENAMNKSKSPLFTTHSIALMGLLLAAEIVLSRFCSIATWNIKIGFTFIPLVLSAGLFGPIGAGVLAALADFLGAILFPIGPYFPGFTFTQFCVGVVFGLLLQKKQSMGHIVGAVLLTQILGSLLLDSYWISVLYGSPYLVLLGTRAIQCAVMSALEIVVIPILLKQLVPRMKAIMA